MNISRIGSGPADVNPKAEPAAGDPVVVGAPDASEADRPDPPAPGDGYVQSFARGLAVLRSFGAEAPSQTLSEAAERTGLTRAGARRILLTLQQLGYVEVDGRRFRLSPKVLELGFAYLSSQPVWQLAQPVMEELTQQLHESCSAAVLDGDEIVYVLRIPVHKIMAIQLGIGSRLPAHCTSMGRVLLAGQLARLGPVAMRERLARTPLEARTALTLTEPDALLAELQRVHDQGYALVAGELEDGLASIAAPVTDRSGRVVAAVNISGQLKRTPPEQMRAHHLPLLLAAAERISALTRAQA